MIKNAGIGSIAITTSTENERRDKSSLPDLTRPTVRLAIWAKSMATLLVLGLLYGCGTFQIVNFDFVAKVNEELDKWSCAALDPGLYEKCQQSFKNNAGLRQVRAHVVVTMFARYGAARLPEYSQDLPNDAAKLLARISDAENELLKTRKIAGDLKAQEKTTDERAAFYPVDRVEALIAIVGVADAATSPTRKGLFNLVVIKSAADRLTSAPGIIRDALRDLLYFNAYRDSMNNLQGVYDKAESKDTSTLKAWAAVDEDLKKSCSLLATYAKVNSYKCIPQ